MKYIDMHCDSITALKNSDQKGLRENSFHIDLLKLKKADYLLQNFAIFTNLAKQENLSQYCKDAIKYYYQEINKNSDLIKPVYCYQDIENNIKNNIMSSLLTIEEGAVIDNNLDNLDYYYQSGVRMITLTWNYPNGIGYPNFTPNKDSSRDIIFQTNTNDGLTDFGIEYLKKMQQIGMIVDVSHLSDKGFYDVYNHTSKPFVASHSNSRTICKVARNLTDDMLIKLADKGGVTGINYCKDFINYNADISYVKDIVEHIKHIRKVAGIDVIGLGSDFDGISNDLEIENASQMDKLIIELENQHFTTEEIDKITHKNVLRVYQQILK